MGDATEASRVPSRYTLKPVTPTASDDENDSDAEVAVDPVSVRLGCVGAMSSTNVCVALAVAVCVQVLAVSFAATCAVRLAPLATPTADVTGIAERMQYAAVPPAGTVAVSGRAPAPQVEVAAPVGTDAASVQDAVLAACHTVTETAAASALELPVPRPRLSVSALATVPAFVMVTPPVADARLDRNVTASAGATVSETETVPPVTLPALAVVAPFHSA